MPPAMAATAPMRSRRGFSSPAAKRAADDASFFSFGELFLLLLLLLLSSCSFSLSLLTHGHHGGESLEHLDERHRQVEVDDVAEVESEGHQKPH